LSDPNYSRPRLLAAAKEFNIGKETLLDFLQKKGHKLSDTSPAARLTEEMYIDLQAEFISDRINRRKTDKIYAACDIIEKCFLAKNPILDLGNCGLVDDDFIQGGTLDRYLQSCDHITTFILSSEWHEFGPSYKREKSSNIGTGNKITKIPDCVASFSLLQSIICCGTQSAPWSIKDLSLLEELPYLSEINFAYNRLLSLSSIPYTCPLTSINLDANELKSLDGIEALDSLVALSVEGNNINDIQPLVNLINLEYLNLSKNSISDVRKLGNLQFLYALYLGENKLYDTSALKNNQRLRLLDLQKNHIKNIENFPRLVNLEILDLAENEITTIFTPGSLSVWETNGLPNLSYLSLKGNLINHIRGKMTLGRIKTISLNTNSLISLDGLQELHSLRKLEVENNELNELGALSAILDIENLEVVRLSYNSVLDKLPEEVIAIGWKAIRDRLRSDSLISFNEVKVLLLGNPNVGKSNLLEYLETKSVPVNKETTFGIQYKQLRLGKSEINMHFWDFGGQEYFHATHQLFFSPGGLHIVLWSRENIQRNDSEPDLCFNLSYWIRCVERLIPNDAINKTDVIVAENKIDLNDYIITPINQLSYVEKYPSLNFEFTNFSVLHLKRVSSFSALLEEYCEKLVKKHPSTYVKYYERIKKSSGNFVSTRDIASDELEVEMVKTAMLVFRNMGLLLYFPNIIPDKVFIKPQVLLDLLYKDILSEQKKAKVSYEEIDHKVNNNTLGISTKEVINLLTHFDLIFEIPVCPNTYFVPQYLKPPHTLVNFFKQHQFLFPDIFIASDHFMMNIAMLRIFSRYGKYVQGKDDQEYLFWKDGIVIEKDELILMINFNRQMERIELYSDVKGKNFPLQKEVIDFILSIPLDRHKRLNEEEEQASPEDDNINWKSNYFSVFISLDGTFYTNWNKLNESVNNDIFQIKVSSVPGNIDEPESAIVSKTVSVFDFNKFLPKKSKGQMKNIFISYSKEDLSLVNKFQEHLSALKLDGKVATWYCTELTAGSEWNFEIQKHFDSADIVCFMISPAFMKTKYIHEHEIMKAFKRKSEDPSFLIVPIILDFCRWSTAHNDLSQFSALPYSAKPVLDFDNQNMAWYIIQECLRAIIEKKVDNHEDDLYTNEALPKDVLRIFERIIAQRVDKNTK
jgi:GTPase SAR1 family protein